MKALCQCISCMQLGLVLFETALGVFAGGWCWSEMQSAHGGVHLATCSVSR